MATLALGRVGRSTERRFYVGLAVAMFAAVFLGFARSFFLRPWFPGVPAPTERIFYVHGAAFTAWCLLMVAQPLLVAGGPALKDRLLLRNARDLRTIGKGVYFAMDPDHRRA